MGPALGKHPVPGLLSMSDSSSKGGASKRLLIVGVPRSGTSWLGRALAMTEDASYVHEPDHERYVIAAMHAKRRLGLFPVLSPGDRAPGYKRLWERAFRDQLETRTLPYRIASRLFWNASEPEFEAALAYPRPRRSLRLRAAGFLGSRPNRDGDEKPLVIVKSAHAALSVEWIGQEMRPTVIVVARQSLDILASWIELGIRECTIALDTYPGVRKRLLIPHGIDPPSRNASPLTRAAWNLGLLGSFLQASARRHPEWRVVSHESLVMDPLSGYRRLCGVLGLGWTRSIEEFLEQSDRPGAGFATNRVAAQLADRWRRVFSDAQAKEVATVLSQFPLQESLA
jgi:hypothetical protein